MTPQKSIPMFSRLRYLLHTAFAPARRWTARRRTARHPTWKRAPDPYVLSGGALKAAGWTTGEYDRLFGGLDAGMRSAFAHASAVDLADAFAASVWVYAATTTRAQAVSDVPLVARDADGEPAPTWHRLARLLPARLLWTIEADLCLFGAALLVKQVNAAGIIAGLRRVNPTQFTVDSTEREGLRGFQVHGSPYEYLYPNQVAYLHRYDPNDDFGGVSPAEVALARAGAERAMMEYALSYFANYGVPDTAFMPPENPDPGVDWEREAFRLAETLETLFKGVRNRARAAVLPARWSIWQAQAQPDGAAMPALSGEIKQAILTAFGVQESLLFSGASNYAEAESDRLNFNQHTIRPEVRFIAYELTEQVVRPHFGDQWRLEADFSQVPAMQADRAARVTTVSAQVAGGYMTLAEAREATYLPADARLKDYVMVQGTPVHLSRLPELYTRLLPPDGLSNLTGGDGSNAADWRSASFPSLPIPGWVTPGTADWKSADWRSAHEPARAALSAAQIPRTGGPRDRKTPDEEGGDSSPRPFDPRPEVRGAIRAALVAWQRAALKGDVHDPADSPRLGDIPAVIAFPLLERLSSRTDSGNSTARKSAAIHKPEVHGPEVRAAFDPAFAAAKGYKPVDLDRWWMEYVAVEREAADRLEAVWRDMQAEMVEALTHLPVGANAETILAMLERVMARYDAAHLAAIDPLVETMFKNGAAMGADQLAVLETPAAKAEMRLGILWDLVNRVAVDWARENAGARVTRITETTRQQVRDLVTQRMAGGLTHEGLIDELSTVFDRKRAELIAQTEATFALDGGQETAWRARGVPASRWHTAGDGYVCALCRTLNGKVAPLGGAFMLTLDELARLPAAQRRLAQRGIKGAPLHPGCRCVRVPDQGLTEDDMQVNPELVEAAVRKLEARAAVEEPVGPPRFVHDESQVVEYKKIPTGITMSYQLTYADGTKAIWKAAKPESGRAYQDADTDVAAYRLSELIYPGLVPDTIHGAFRGQDGTVQRFVDDAQIGAEYDGDVTELPRDQVEAMMALDLIIQNYDRHYYNWLIDPHGNLVAIDNSAGEWVVWDDWISGRYFAHHSLLSEQERMRGRFVFSEGTIERLRSITREAFFQALEGLGGRVNAENAWANLQRIIERGEIRW